jgi:hypothetical protein
MLHRLVLICALLFSFTGRSQTFHFKYSGPFFDFEILPDGYLLLGDKLVRTDLSGNVIRSVSLAPQATPRLRPDGKLSYVIPGAQKLITCDTLGNVLWARQLDLVDFVSFSVLPDNDLILFSRDTIMRIGADGSPKYKCSPISDLWYGQALPLSGGDVLLVLKPGYPYNSLEVVRLDSTLSVTRFCKYIGGAGMTLGGHAAHIMFDEDSNVVIPGRNIHTSGMYTSESVIVMDTNALVQHAQVDPHYTSSSSASYSVTTSIAEEADGFIMTYYIAPGSLLLVKMDESLNVLWERILPSGDYASVKPAQDGTYLVLLNNGHFMKLDSTGQVSCLSLTAWNTTYSNLSLTAANSSDTVVPYTVTPLSVTSHLQSNVSTTLTNFCFDGDVESTDAGSITVYPNPAMDGISVSCDRFVLQNALVEVFDVSGRVVRVYKNVDASKVMDVSTLETGSYFLRISTEQNIQTLKFQIIR